MVSWGIKPSQLQVILVLSSSEMVKAVVESGMGTAALPELMVQKELNLAMLYAIQVIDQSNGAPRRLEIVQPVLKLKHRQRVQTKLAIAFEQLLVQEDSATIPDIA